MGLKNLLRRASGLITAFALLASMMVVAGAASPVRGTFHCAYVEMTVMIYGV